jgi:ABC-type branched-subunit amino acid transport system substrate-binding protein
MHRSLWLRRVAAATALALAITACGGDEEPEAPADDAVEEPADDATEEEPADDAEEEPADDATAEDDGGEEEAVEAPERDEVLDLAYILPETGPLAFLGPPQIEAVNMAVEDINAAGGVLGSDVNLATGDEAGDATIVRQSATTAINDGADAIIGAASSGMSQEFIQLTADNSIVQCSASNTAPDFTEQENNAFYFRTVPPDAAVAPIIANTVVGDGYSSPAILARADDYGTGLRTLVEEGLTEQGVTPVVSEDYDPESDDFSALVSEVTAAGADSAVVIGFDEAGGLYGDLIEAGLGPVGLYGGDGVFGPALADLVGTDITGLKVIGAAGDAEFNDRLSERLGEEEAGNLIYGGQAYDCAIVIALAAAVSESADPAVFNDSIEAVTNGSTECTSFEECIGIIDGGDTDIDYVGASGPLDLTRPDPTVGRYAIGEFTAEGLEIVGDEDVNLADVG